VTSGPSGKFNSVTTSSTSRSPPRESVWNLSNSRLNCCGKSNNDEEKCRGLCFCHDGGIEASWSESTNDERDESEGEDFNLSQKTPKEDFLTATFSGGDFT
jgi:hypothetical protein